MGMATIMTMPEKTDVPRKKEFFHLTHGAATIRFYITGPGGMAYSQSPIPS